MSEETMMAAPEDIAYLLEEVERLRKQVQNRDKAAKRVILREEP